MMKPEPGTLYITNNGSFPSIYIVWYSRVVMDYGKELADKLIGLAGNRCAQGMAEVAAEGRIARVGHKDLPDEYYGDFIWGVYDKEDGYKKQMKKLIRKLKE